MSRSFVNWTSRVAIAGRVAERVAPTTGTARYQAITTCPWARPKPKQKPRNGSGRFKAQLGVLQIGLIAINAVNAALADIRAFLCGVC